MRKCKNIRVHLVKQQLFGIIKKYIMDWVYNICGCMGMTDKLQKYWNWAHTETKKQPLDEQQHQPIHHQKQPDTLPQAPPSIHQHPEQKDLYWYPGSSTPHHLQQLYQHKLSILQHILRSSCDGYDKIYDSQDQTKLQIYSKPTTQGNKKVNIFRFTFRMPDTKIHQYVDWCRSNPPSFEPLLEDVQVVREDKGEEMCISKRQYKKVLVINPHQFTVYSGREIVQDEEEWQENEQNKVNVYTTVFSVKQEAASSPYSQGWANLCGLRVRNESEEYLAVEGYINMQLEVSVSLAMLKQPLSKQIRSWIQKLLLTIKQQK